jgi:hypothetical protein
MSSEGVTPGTVTKKQTPMPLIAGILMIVSEGFEFLIGLGWLFLMPAGPRSAAFLGFFVLFLLLAMVAVVIAGGVFAILRRHWGWALAGAIISIFPFSLFGVAATVLVALSRDEFE